MCTTADRDRIEPCTWPCCCAARVSAAACSLSGPSFNPQSRSASLVGAAAPRCLSGGALDANGSRDRSWQQVHQLGGVLGSWPSPSIDFIASRPKVRIALPVLVCVFTWPLRSAYAPSDAVRARFSFVLHKPCATFGGISIYSVARVAHVIGSRQQQRQRPEAYSPAALPDERSSKEAPKQGCDGCGGEPAEPARARPSCTARVSKGPHLLSLHASRQGAEGGPAQALVC